MSFPLVPNSVTLDDLERRNSPNRRVMLPNSVAFRADYVKVVQDTQYYQYHSGVWGRSLSFAGDSDSGPYLSHMDFCVILLQSIWLLCNFFTT